MNQNKYIEALKQGRELVVIAADEDHDSAIFYLELSTNELITFSRHMGEIERLFNANLQERMKEHFSSIEKEGGHIFIRGWDD